MSAAAVGSQRGMSESVQWTLLAPLIMLCVIGIVQAGVVLHARNTVAAAAMAAAEAEALAGAQSGDGRAIAERMTRGLTQVRVVTTRSGGLARVEVSGRAPLFFDLGQARVSSTAVQPLEEP